MDRLSFIREIVSIVSRSLRGLHERLLSQRKLRVLGMHRGQRRICAPHHHVSNKNPSNSDRPPGMYQTIAIM